MLSTKKTTWLLMIAIAWAMTTLAVCAYSFYCFTQNQQHTCLFGLLVNTKILEILIGGHIIAQAFLLASVIWYCKQSSLKKDQENWTQHLNWLDRDFETFL